MAFEAVRGYLQLASGLGELTKARALEASQGLLALPGADEVGKRAKQVSMLADQLLEAAKANRAALVELVRAEVDSALGRADLARRADLETARSTIVGLAREVDELRASLTAAAARTPLGALPGLGAAAVGTVSRQQATGTAAEGAAASTSAPSASAKKTTARKTTASKAAARKTRARKTTAGKAAARKTAAGTTAAKKTSTKTATAKKAAAKKAAAKKATSRNTAAAKASTPSATDTPATGATDTTAAAPETPAAAPETPAETPAPTTNADTTPRTEQE
ncbi:MAG TPA: histone H1-like repetitive region-containing protein [Pedococcus sp.]